MADTRTLPKTDLTVDDARSKLAGWHFSQEALSSGEREILYVAEALLRLIDEPSADVQLTAFVLEDFPDLTPEERQLLATDEYALGKLRDRFLEACGWSEAAEVAVEAWRTAFFVREGS